MSTTDAKMILKEQLEQYFSNVTPAIIRKAVKDGKLDNDLEIYQLANAYLGVAAGTKSGYQLALEVSRTSGALEILPYAPASCAIWKRVVTLTSNGEMILSPGQETLFKEIFDRFCDCYSGSSISKKVIKLVGEDFYGLAGTYGAIWAGGSKDASYLTDKKCQGSGSYKIEPGRTWSNMTMTFDGTVRFQAGHLEDLYVPAPVVLENFIATEK